MNESKAKYGGTIPKVKDCIQQITASGSWRYCYYNNPWYVFRNTQNNMEVTFVLAELRHAATYGW